MATSPRHRAESNQRTRIDEGVARNERNYLYTRISRTQRAALRAKLEGDAKGQRTNFDLVLG